MLFERQNTHSGNWGEIMKSRKTTQSFQPKSYSTLGPAAFQRIQEWDCNSYPDRHATINRERKNNRTFSQGSWRDQKHRPRTTSTQSLGFDPEFDDNDDVTPWDSISMTSSRNESFDHRDSGSFEMLGEELEQGHQYSNTGRRWNGHEKGHPRSKSKRSGPNLRKIASRGAAMKRLNSQNNQVDQYDKGSNSKLLSCIDSLDYLSKKLENVTRVSNEIGKFRNVASESLTQENWEDQYSPQNERENARARNLIEDDKIFHKNMEGRYRQISYESASSDSGVNFNNEYIPEQFEDGFTSSASLPPLSQKSLMYQSKYQKNPHYRFDQAEENSSGYSSESSSQQKPHSAGKYFSQANSQMPNGESGYPYPGQSQESWYDCEGIYGAEDPYGYGTFGYASSSVYDEELHQNNGWFYLPTHQQGVSPANEPSTAHQGQSAAVQQKSYDQTAPNYSGSQTLYSTNISTPSLQQPTWPGASYGALSETFLNPMEGMSPLGAAISATCANDYFGSDSNGLNSTQNFGANVLPVSSNSVSGEGKKRKSVRFSQTVQQRVEKNALEVEDSTSIIKGGDDKPETKPQKQFDVNSSALFSSAVYDGTVDQQPVYAYPKSYADVY